MRLLQNFEIFLIMALLAYVAYKVAVLIDTMGRELRNEEQRRPTRNC